jgi:hypothetical protein
MIKILCPSTLAFAAAVLLFPSDTQAKDLDFSELVILHTELSRSIDNNTARMGRICEVDSNCTLENLCPLLRENLRLASDFKKATSVLYYKYKATTLEQLNRVEATYRSMEASSKRNCSNR